MTNPDLLESLRAIVRQIPDIVTVRYAGRSSGDTFSTDTQEFEARQEPTTSGDVGGLAKRWCRWVLFATGGQTARPVRKGKITEPDGTVWHIQNVVQRYGIVPMIFDCDSTQEVA
jgi:hypothetical protein